MKIDLVISNLGHGGAQRVASSFCNFFQIKGHEVRLITTEVTPDEYDIDSQVNRIRLDGKFSLNKKFGKFISLLKFYSSKKNRPDIAISFLTATNLIAILACRINKIPIVSCEHNNHTFVPSPKWLTKFNWNYIYPLANCITVLTKFDVPFFENKGCKVAIMPNPCSFEPAAVRKNKEKVILAVGNLNRYHHKGFDNLLLIIKPILEKYPDWKLKIVGGGNKGKAYLMNLAKSQGIFKNIVFTGFTSEVSQLMSESSIFVLSSRYEGLPMVLLEAMSQGMACISYDCVTGPSEMIESNINGILVEDQNSSLMKKAILDLIQNKDLRITLGQNATKSLEKYDIKNIYKEWEIIFNDIGL